MSARIFLFLDYDGTLVPICGTPDGAVLPAPTRQLLRELADYPLVTVAVVTGRSLRSIRSMVGLDNLVYAGNHGLEIKVPGLPPRIMAGPDARRNVTRIARSLRRELSHVRGVLVENKGLTLSLHYRLVDRENLSAVRAAFLKAAGPLVAAGRIVVNPGKKVLEAKPAVPWDKGAAVRWILKEFGGAPGRDLSVYIGDDATDESAFAALAKRGMTVKVGTGGETKAQYRLKNAAQVVALLHRIREVCSGV